MLAPALKAARSAVGEDDSSTLHGHAARRPETSRRRGPRVSWQVAIMEILAQSSARHARMMRRSVMDTASTSAPVAPQCGHRDMGHLKLALLAAYRAEYAAGKQLAAKRHNRGRCYPVLPTRTVQLLTITSWVLLVARILTRRSSSGSTTWRAGLDTLTGEAR